MSNYSKTKGTAWESKVVEYLSQWWPHVERRALNGVNDKGDIAGIPLICIECKAHASWAPTAWLKELDVETINAAADFGAVFAKVKGNAQPVDGVILLRPEVFVRLLKAAGY